MNRWGAVKASASAATAGDDVSLWSTIDPKAPVWVDFSLKFPIKGCGRFVSYSKLTHRRRRKRRGDWLEWRVHIKAVSRELTRECQFIIQVMIGRASLTYNSFPNICLRQDISVHDVQTFSAQIAEILFTVYLSDDDSQAHLVSPPKARYSLFK